MLPEGVDYSWTEYGGLEFTPGVSSPVHQPWDEIDCQLSKDETDKSRHGALMIFDCLFDQNVPEVKAETEVGGLPQAKIPRVVVFP